MSNRTRRSVLATGALAVPATLALSSCAGTGGGATANENGVTPITLASQNNTTGFSQWLAKELGYFEEANLGVDIQYAESGGALLASGAAGDWQAGWIGAPPLLSGFDTFGLIPTGTMLTENKNIILFMNQAVLEGRTPAEALADTTVGVVANSVSAQLLYACAEKLGVDAADVETVPLSPPAIVNSMLNGDIDAGVAFSTYNWPLVEDPDKYVQVCNGDDAGVLLSDPYVVTPRFWKNNPEAAAAFLEAAYRANEYILETPMEEILPHLMKYLDSIGVDITEEGAKYSLSVRTHITLEDALEQMRSGELSDGLRATAEFLVEAGVYEETPDVDTMTEQGLEVLEAAAALRN